MTHQRTAAFIDGENLVFRYQDMVKTGAQPKPQLAYRPDEFVWSSRLFHAFDFHFDRVSYYTSVVGDDSYLGEVVDAIQDQFASNPIDPKNRTAIRLDARVFKKPAKTQKSRHVDIHITLDSLRAAYRHDIEQVLLVTGDGDFLPVIEEIKRAGKRVLVAGLSKGLAPAIKRAPDEFWLLDNEFFSSIPQTA